MLSEKFPGLVVAGARDGYFDIRDESIPNEIAASGAKILLAGKNLLVDPEHGDEGVELRDETTGETLCTGEVLKSSMTTLDCVFASPLANGRYRLAVRTRAAQSAKIPSVATRAIAFRHTG